MSVFYALRRGRHGSSLMYFLSRLSRQYGAAWWLALALAMRLAMWQPLAVRRRALAGFLARGHCPERRLAIAPAAARA